MPGRSIPENATIAEIVEKLNNAEEYLRQVSAHMYECKSQFDAVSVRIGVTGKALAPHYRIEYREGPELWRGQAVFAVYHGRSHKQMDLGERQLVLDEGEPQKPSPDHLLMDQNWSTRTMNLDEVMVALGNLRQRKHPSRARSASDVG